MNIVESYASFHQYNCFHIYDGLIDLTYNIRRETEPLYVMGEIIRNPIRDDIIVHATFNRTSDYLWGNIINYKKIYLHFQSIIIIVEDIINLEKQSNWNTSSYTITIKSRKIQVTNR